MGKVGWSISQERSSKESSSKGTDTMGSSYTLMGQCMKGSGPRTRGMGLERSTSRRKRRSMGCSNTEMIQEKGRSLIQRLETSLLGRSRI